MTDAPADLTNFADVFVEGLTPELRDEFASLGETVGMEQVWEFALRNHVRVLNPTNFVRIGDKEIIGDKAFTSQFARVVNGIVGLPRQYRDNPVKFAIGTKVRLASEAIYEPGLGDWPTPTKFNMYRPAGYAEIAERPDVFLEHLVYLIPDRLERNLMLAYLKWMIQRPQDKMTFALLIVGRRGVGKSWLSKFFKALFGAHNVLVIERGARVADRFNDDEKNKQVVFVDELVPDGKTDLARAITPRIIAETVTIEGKGVNKFTVPNRYNIVAISNFENAIRIEGRQDRKWLIVRATPTLYGADADGKPTIDTKEYYDRLHAMVKLADPGDPSSVTDEIKRCLWWLRTQPMKTKTVPDFNGQGIAPMTPTKDDVATITETTIESTLGGAYADGIDGEGPFRFELFTVEDVRLAYVENDGRPRQQIDGDISAAMEELGCRRVGSKQVYLGGRKPRRLWCRNERLLTKYLVMTARELADAYKAERKGKKPDPVAEGRADFEEE
jgi:Family of unknown function (DUF5906)